MSKWFSVLLSSTLLHCPQIISSFSIGIMENVFTAAKPFLTFASSLGFFPLSFEDNVRCGVLKTSWNGLIATFSCLFTLFSLTVANSSKVKVFLTAGSKIMMIAWIVLSNFELASFYFMFSYQLYKRKNILQFLILLNQFDQEVSFSEFDKLSF